jgi:hypothetical protein
VKSLSTSKAVSFDTDNDDDRTFEPTSNTDPTKPDSLQQSLKQSKVQHKAPEAGSISTTNLSHLWTFIEIGTKTQAMTPMRISTKCRKIMGSQVALKSSGFGLKIAGLGKSRKGLLTFFSLTVH